MSISGFVQALSRASGLIFNNRKDIGEPATGEPTLGRGLGAVLAAYYRGDYESGIKIVETLKKKDKETSDYRYYRGLMAYQLGQFEEAEDCFRKVLEFTDTELHQGARYLLGEVLRSEGRGEDAIICFEEFTKLWPEQGWGHRGIAEVRLAAGVSPETALARARAAVDLDRRARENAAEDADPEPSKRSLADSLATLAWAVGASHGGEWDLDKLSAESVGLYGRLQDCPDLARIHCLLGLGYQAARVNHKAAMHFEKAATPRRPGLLRSYSAIADGARDSLTTTCWTSLQ